MPAPKEPYFADPERAAEASRKGVERREELRKLRLEDPMRYLGEKFATEGAGLTDLLLDAAYGRKSFAGTITGECPGCGTQVDVVVPALAPDKRLAAVTKALEFAAGRPSVRKDVGPKEPPSPPGLSIE